MTPEQTKSLQEAILSDDEAALIKLLGFDPQNPTMEGAAKAIEGVIEGQARIIAELKTRVAKDQNDNRWYAADDPPEDIRNVLIVTSQGYQAVGFYDRTDSNWWISKEGRPCDVFAWRYWPEPPTSIEDLSRREPQPKGEQRP